MPAFLDDIPGIRDVQREDEPALPRRNRLALYGPVTVEDNPAANATDITFEGPPLSLTITVSLTAEADGLHLTHADIADAALVRLLLPAARAVHGIDVDAAPKIVLINASIYQLTLVNNSGYTQAGAQIVCPGDADYAVAAGAAVELVRDTVSVRWRVVL